MLQLQFLNTAKPPVWLVDAKFTIGSSAAASCVLPLPGLLPEHASLMVAHNVVDIIPYSPAAYTALNGQLVRGRTRLQHGDILTLGSAQIAVVEPKQGPKNGQLAPVSWRLQAKNTALAQRQYPLKAATLLGRSAECDICLALAHLSRRHALFSVSSRGLEVEDLGSSNGTFVNGKKVQRALLNNGDDVSFEALHFTVVGPEEPSDNTDIRPASNSDESARTKILPAPAVLQSRRSRITPPALRPLTAPAQTHSYFGLNLALVLTLTVFGLLIWLLLRS